MAHDNPLAGISVPSVEELIDRAIAHLGTNGIIDLSNASQRLRLRDALVRTFGCEMRWRFAKAFQQASERAISHVVKLSVDPEYQEKKAAARERSRADAKKRKVESAKQQAVADEAYRQKRAGLVQ
jgi:hypothetical protein